MKKVYCRSEFKCPYCGTGACFSNYEFLTCNGRREEGCRKKFRVPTAEAWKYFVAVTTVEETFESEKDYVDFLNREGKYKNYEGIFG